MKQPYVWGTAGLIAIAGAWALVVSNPFPIGNYPPRSAGSQTGTTLSISVHFQTVKDNPGLLDCGKTAPVARILPNTGAVAAAALNELFKGPTEPEKKNGFLGHWITEETASSLKRVFIKDGTAYLDWKDIRNVVPNASSSCGSAGFLKPIEATLKQFPTVTRVIHAIDGQPSLFYGWIQAGCSAENDDCDTAPYGATPPLPASCKEEDQGQPVISSLSAYSGSAETKLEIRGCNFSGFEGDKNAWIENDQGTRGIIYGGTGSTSQLLSVALKPTLCQKDTSYSGLACDAWISLVPGTYRIYVSPWGKQSNKVEFTVR